MDTKPNTTLIARYQFVTGCQIAFPYRLSKMKITMTNDANKSLSSCSRVDLDGVNLMVEWSYSDGDRKNRIKNGIRIDLDLSGADKRSVNGNKHNGGCADAM